MPARRPTNLKIAERVSTSRWSEADPVIAEITTLIIESGLSIGEIVERVLDASNNQVHLSYKTIDNWLTGKIRRPQNFTVTWVARGLGYHRPFRRIGRK